MEEIFWAGYGKGVDIQLSQKYLSNEEIEDLEEIIKKYITL